MSNGSKHRVCHNFLNCFRPKLLSNFPYRDASPTFHFRTVRDSVQKVYVNAQSNLFSDMPDFPVAADMEKYLLMYAKHFHLEPRARLNTTVYRANWSEERKQWELEISSGSTPRFYEFFDKVVFSLGPDQIPNIPNLSGIEKFQGDVQHSISFKRYARPSSCSFHFSWYVC